MFEIYHGVDIIAIFWNRLNLSEILKKKKRAIEYSGQRFKEHAEPRERNEKWVSLFF